MKDSEEIRFLEGTCGESDVLVQAAREQARVEASRRDVRWAIGGLIWGVFTVPPACLLLLGVPSSPLQVVGVCALTASGLVALAFSLKRLMGKC